MARQCVIGGVAPGVAAFTLVLFTSVVQAGHPGGGHPGPGPNGPGHPGYAGHQGYGHPYLPHHRYYGYGYGYPYYGFGLSFYTGPGYYGSGYYGPYGSVYGPGAYGGGYDLDDTFRGYYGGNKYQSYYNYGRGAYGAYPGYVGIAIPLTRPTPPPPRYPLPLPPPPYANVSRGNTAQVIVEVPAGAEVWLEGVKMKQTGPTRGYVTPPLDPGDQYEYEIKTRWTQNGEEVERSKTVAVYAGAKVRVTFHPIAEPDVLPAPKKLNIEALESK